MDFFDLLLEVLPDFLVGDLAVCVGQHERVLNVEQLPPHPHLAEHVVVASLEVITGGKIKFDMCMCVFSLNRLQTPSRRTRIPIIYICFKLCYTIL